MPISPDDGARLSAQVVQIVQQAEDQINQTISRALAKGAADGPTWALQKQAQLRGLQQQLSAIVTATDQRVQVAVGQVVQVASDAGVGSALDDLIANNLVPSLPPAQAQALLALATDIRNSVLGGMGQVLRQAPDIYQKIVGTTVVNMTLGTLTRRQATQLAVNQFAAEGITSFVDSAGRHWNLGSYSEMATRTGTARAAIDGHLRTLTANGDDLVYIIPGPRACPICDAWAGRVLSITGQTPGYATIDEARAAGWGHPNCRCSTGIYIEGITNPKPVRPDDSGYEAGQRQREIERNIRRYKTKATMAQTTQAAAVANGKVKEWQGALRQHLADHPDLKRLPYRESPVRPRSVIASVTAQQKSPLDMDFSGMMAAKDAMTKDDWSGSIRLQDQWFARRFNTEVPFDAARGLTGLSDVNRKIRDAYVANDAATLAMNRSMRQGGTLTQKMRKTEDMIAQSTVAEPLTTYRGAVLTDDVVERLTPGAAWSDLAFQSTDLTPGTAKFYANERLRDGTPGRVVMFEYDLQPGMQARYVGSGEVVVQRNTPFMIDQVFTKDDILTVRLKAVR